MTRWRLGVALCAVLVAVAAAHGQARGVVVGESRPDVAERLLAEANQARRQVGAGPLKWDEALAAAALKHSQRMAAEGLLEHRLRGEQDVLERTAGEGAHFSLIEENIGVASSDGMLHPGWMNSPDHRKNLLNPAVDRVGIGVVFARGYYYATADYARGAAALNREEVEAAVERLVQAQGVALVAEKRGVREACAMDRGLPKDLMGDPPQFAMRWENSDLSKLPPELAKRLGTRDYRRAAVGSCTARGETGAFTVYRVAVLLY